MTISTLSLVALRTHSKSCKYHIEFANKCAQNDPAAYARQANYIQLLWSSSKCSLNYLQAVWTPLFSLLEPSSWIFMANPSGQRLAPAKSPSQLRKCWCRATPETAAPVKRSAP